MKTMATSQAGIARGRWIEGPARLPRCGHASGILMLGHLPRARSTTASSEDRAAAPQG